MDGERSEGANPIRVPVPDPTVLTTAQLNREIGALKEIIFTRLDAMDRALDLSNDSLHRVPSDTEKQIEHLKALHEEKFSSIDLRFVERDTRTEQTSRDSKVAVDAALQAAKEAVGEQNKSSALAIAKSEGATTKQIDQLGVLITSTNSAVNEKIDDVKDRLTLIEGKGYGQSAAQTTQQTSASFMVALVVAAVSIVGFILMLASRFGQGG